MTTLRCAAPTVIRHAVFSPLVLLAVAACAPPAGGEAAPAPRLFAPAGEPLPTLTDDETMRFERGRVMMTKRFAPSQGLGPAYGATFCAGCHEKPVIGGTASRYRNSFVQVAEGPSLVVELQGHFDVEAGRAADPEGVDTRARSPLPFFGAGLLAQIPVEAILSRADPNDVNGDGISGRVNFERGFVGRFGRKAQMSTLTDFVRLALLDHMGITTDPLVVEGLEAAGPVGLPTADGDGVADPELGREDLADLISFVAFLAPPEPDPPTSETRRGRALFLETGCGDCHVPALEGPRGPVPAYTDLLLHDLGEDLADGVEIGEATGSELRTQPLWGIAAVGPYLHDGRADTLDDAVRWHGGEAEGARERYIALHDGDREAVLAFLRSLGGSGHRPDGLLPSNAAAPETGAPGGPQRLLDPASAERFRAGRELFDRDFGLAGGLGPLFNGDACRSCHFDAAIGGAGPSGVDVLRQAALGGDSPLEPPLGTIAHRHHAEGGRPPPDSAADFFEPRQTPALFGLGLVDAVPESAILALADPEDVNGDGIRGRAHVLPDGRVGRFGWKASVPTLRDFTRDALSNELGLTVPAEAGSGFGATSDDDAVADPEVTADAIDDLTFFMQELGPLPPRATSAHVREDGAALFETLGCASCHVPELTTRDGVPVPLYSDLLLHDVAPADAPLVGDGDAGRAFRTPPLWGLDATAPYMHDGRAETIEEAIARHDGEAAASRAAFEARAASDQATLIAFLRSL